MAMKQPRHLTQQRHRNFLLSFFDPDNNEFQIKEVNGYILTKNRDSASGNAYVAIYTKDSWQKAQQMSLLFDQSKDSQ